MSSFTRTLLEYTVATEPKSKAWYESVLEFILEEQRAAEQADESREGRLRSEG